MTMNILNLIEIIVQLAYAMNWVRKTRELRNSQSNEKEKYQEASEEEKRDKYYGTNRAISAVSVVAFAVILIFGVKSQADRVCPNGQGIAEGVVCSPCTDSQCVECTSDNSQCTACTNGFYPFNSHCSACDQPLTNPHCNSCD